MNWTSVLALVGFSCETQITVTITGTARKVAMATHAAATQAGEDVTVWMVSNLILF